MASIYIFETRDERIERMYKDNPGRPIELCTAVIDGIWDKRRQLNESRIPVRFKDASIMELGYVTDKILDSFKTMFDDPSKNNKVGIIFCGPSGSGKTHAAYAVMHMINEANPEMIGYMTTYSEALSELKNEFHNGSYEDLGSVWDKLNNDSGMYDGVLLVDDVSSQKLTDFEVDKLMMFLERRFNSYMPFILTTNVKPKDFKQVFGERLASRLLGYCEIVLFEEKDVRIKEESL